MSRDTIYENTMGEIKEKIDRIYRDMFADKYREYGREKLQDFFVDAICLETVAEIIGKQEELVPKYDSNKKIINKKISRNLIDKDFKKCFSYKIPYYNSIYKAYECYYSVICSDNQKRKEIKCKNVPGYIALLYFIFRFCSDRNRYKTYNESLKSNVFEIFEDLLYKHKGKITSETLKMLSRRLSRIGVREREEDCSLHDIHIRYNHNIIYIKLMSNFICDVYNSKIQELNKYYLLDVFREDVCIINYLIVFFKNVERWERLLFYTLPGDESTKEILETTKHPDFEKDKEKYVTNSRIIKSRSCRIKISELLRAGEENYSILEKYPYAGLCDQTTLYDNVIINGCKMPLYEFLSLAKVRSLCKSIVKHADLNLYIGLLILSNYYSYKLYADEELIEGFVSIIRHTKKLIKESLIKTDMAEDSVKRKYIRLEEIDVVYLVNRVSTTNISDNMKSFDIPIVSGIQNESIYEKIALVLGEYR